MLRIDGGIGGANGPTANGGFNNTIVTNGSANNGAAANPTGQSGIVPNGVLNNGGFANSAPNEAAQSNQSPANQSPANQSPLQQAVLPQQANSSQPTPQQAGVQPYANGLANRSCNQGGNPARNSRANEFQARSQYLTQELPGAGRNPSRFDGPTPGVSLNLRRAGQRDEAAVDLRSIVSHAPRAASNDQRLHPRLFARLAGDPAATARAACKTCCPTLNCRPSPRSAPSEPAHMLASLPVRLELGTLAAAAAEGMSPVRMSLVGAWAAMVLAALAVAALLQGVLSLSERRGAFVSAVTHELRTPLTTFRMYAEMLASNMVPDETSRQHYLETLRVEADRLTHLVENVLLYARLERGRPGGRTSPVAVSRILEQATGRLTDRAGKPIWKSPSRRATPSAKAACWPIRRPSSRFCSTWSTTLASMQPPRPIARSISKPERSGDHVELLLRDHGPGIAAEQRRVLFQPFRKSARDAAHSAPGVGLGLALCRRLARDMGGELSYAPMRPAERVLLCGSGRR